jgi:hypothetical protein
LPEFFQFTNVCCATESRQELYKVAQRADGLAVREDDAEPELLDDESMLLGDGETVAMAVKEPPLLWRTFPAGRITLSEDGAVAMLTMQSRFSLTTAGTELTEGRHYWEVELLSEDVTNILIGCSRSNLDPTQGYYKIDCTDCWFIECSIGGLWGNGKNYDDPAGPYTQGDRVGMLLDLNDGSLRFFENGVQHGPGYPAGSVTGPVVHAAQMLNVGASVRLLPNAEAPVGN